MQETDQGGGGGRVMRVAALILGVVGGLVGLFDSVQTLGRDGGPLI